MSRGTGWNVSTSRRAEGRGRRMDRGATDELVSPKALAGSGGPIDAGGGRAWRRASGRGRRPGRWCGPPGCSLCWPGLYGHRKPLVPRGGSGCGSGFRGLILIAPPELSTACEEGHSCSPPQKALGHALPVGQALVLCPVAFQPRGRPSVRLQPTARRRGSPGLRRPGLPTGQSGVSQVTGPSSLSVPLATHPAGLPSTRLRASGSAAFQAKNPLSTGNLCHFGADTGGPLTRLATLQPPPYEDDGKPGYQPAGYALAGWGSHPQDDSSEFQSIS
jgi:hypothetical protein